jgi:PAS domain S-box-containing protein
VHAPTRIVTDSRGRIVETSAGAGELLAVEERVLVGRALATFVAEGQRHEFRTLLLDLLRGAGPVQTSLELRRRDGAKLPVDVEVFEGPAGERLEWLISPDGNGSSHDGDGYSWDGDGDGNGNGAAARSLRLPAPALAEAGLLDRLPFGVVAVSRELEVEYLNRAARAQLDGVQIGGPLPDPWPAFDLPGFARRLFGIGRAGPHMVDAGEGGMLEVDGVPAGFDGNALVIVQDVTFRERRQRAEQEFVSNAAHELRTPIAAIASTVEVLQRGAKEKPQDRDLFLGHIERETERLSRLASSLLLLARVETGQEAPLLELVDVRRLLDQIGAAVEAKDGVTVEVACEPGVAVLADEDLLRQAVWNLAMNAARHTTAGRIELIGRNAGALSEIDVVDTGPGIAVDDQARAFDRFYRGGSPRAGEGFGLGLSISRAIARALGGDASLSSEPGLGTRVRLLIPSAHLIHP